jgi:hypothetical protein
VQYIIIRCYGTPLTLITKIKTKKTWVEVSEILFEDYDSQS